MSPSSSSGRSLNSGAAKIVSLVGFRSTRFVRLCPTSCAPTRARDGLHRARQGSAAQRARRRECRRWTPPPQRPRPQRGGHRRPHSSRNRRERTAGQGHARRTGCTARQDSGWHRYASELGVPLVAVVVVDASWIPFRRPTLTGLACARSLQDPPDAQHALQSLRPAAPEISTLSGLCRWGFPGVIGTKKTAPTPSSALGPFFPPPCAIRHSAWHTRPYSRG